MPSALDGLVSNTVHCWRPDHNWQTSQVAHVKKQRHSNTRTWIGNKPTRWRWAGNWCKAVIETIKIRCYIILFENWRQWRRPATLTIRTEHCPIKGSYLLGSNANEHQGCYTLTSDNNFINSVGKLTELIYYFANTCHFGELWTTQLNWFTLIIMHPKNYFHAPCVGETAGNFTIRYNQSLKSRFWTSRP